MEANALRLSNLETALSGFINDFIANYKSLLIRDNKKATGNLIQSIRPLSIEVRNNKVIGEIKLADYWKYVEYGRKPGKFPPIDKILGWVKAKPVLPRPMNGLREPSEKQIAFLIARKIARDGIKPGNQYEEALDYTWRQWEQKINDAIDKDLQEAIDLVTLK